MLAEPEASGRGWSSYEPHLSESGGQSVCPPLTTSVPHWGWARRGSHCQSAAIEAVCLFMGFWEASLGRWGRPLSENLQVSLGAAVASTGQSLREEKAGRPQPQAVSPGLYKVGRGTETGLHSHVTLGKLINLCKMGKSLLLTLHHSTAS